MVATTGLLYTLLYLLPLDFLQRKSRVRLCPIHLTPSPPPTTYHTRFLPIFLDDPCITQLCLLFCHSSITKAACKVIPVGYNRMSYVNYKVVKKTQTYILMLCKKLNSSLESEQLLSNSTLLQKRPPNCYIKTVRLFCPQKKTTFYWV